MKKLQALPNFPHDSHKMEKKVYAKSQPHNHYGVLNPNNRCVVCGAAMCGNPRSWEHDIALEVPCEGKYRIRHKKVR